MVNPLVTYKNVNNVSWNTIAKNSGISLSQINRLATWTPSKMRDSSIDTAIRLKRLGIDCVDYAETFYSDNA